MDISMKERGVGAAVVVLLCIIVIPWVLEGPAPGRSVTRNVPLPAAETTAAPAEIRMPLGGQPDASASPATNSPSSSTSGQVSASTPQAAKAPAAAPAKAQSIARQAAAGSAVNSNGKWMVQAGSYGSERNAIRLQRTLEKHGYHVEISRYSMGKRTYYRVRVGPYQDPAAARKVIPEINRIYGGKAKVVPNS